MIGLLINFVVSPVDVQDRNMIAPLLVIACKPFPSLEKAMADGGYQGKPTAEDVQELSGISLETVKRSDTAKGFYVLPKRWIVERTYTSELIKISDRRISGKSPMLLQDLLCKSALSCVIMAG